MQESKNEVNDEKNIISIFSCYFLDFIFGHGLRRGKNCPINHTRLYRLKLQ